MNTKTKRRMIVVAGVIAIVVIVMLAVVGGSTAAKVVTVSDVTKSNYEGQKIQVTGTVVDNSYSIDSKGVLTFSIYDADNNSGDTLKVTYDQGVSATFGNGVSAICTGRMGSDGVLSCTELVTKCPSKYESATDALTIDQLLGYGQTMIGRTTKVKGTVSGAPADATQTVRLTIVSSDGATLPIHFEGALSSKVVEGANVVIMGALSEDGSFLATDVSLEG